MIRKTHCEGGREEEEGMEGGKEGEKRGCKKVLSIQSFCMNLSELSSIMLLLT
jgi:hypothetical protein